MGGRSKAVYHFFVFPQIILGRRVWSGSAVAIERAGFKGMHFQRRKEDRMREFGLRYVLLDGDVIGISVVVVVEMGDFEVGLLDRT